MSVLNKVLYPHHLAKVSFSLGKICGAGVSPSRETGRLASQPGCPRNQIWFQILLKHVIPGRTGIQENTAEKEAEFTLGNMQLNKLRISPWVRGQERK